MSGTLKIRLSCAVKLHAFQLAEQFDRHGMLDFFYTVYHAAKNPLVARFNQRKDLEKINPDRIKTFPLLAPLIRLRNSPYKNNAIFDARVAADLKRNPDYHVFVGWSGMSIRCIDQALRDGRKAVLERGSSHIRYQFALLDEEYRKWGLTFKGDPRVADQEEEEYRKADCIVVPSGFVERTFIEKGFPREKLFRNNFGSNSYFRPSKPKRDKFTILYVGNLSIRKGLPYLFEALSHLPLDPTRFDVWFIGNIQPEIQAMIPKFQQPNWKFFGHVNHYELADYISPCSVAIHPSLEEGMSMVISQLMACGTPVIATTNTGGEDIIVDGYNGHIVPIRDPFAIASRITALFDNPDSLRIMQQKAIDYATSFGSWDQYGDRYANFINKLSV